MVVVDAEVGFDRIEELEPRAQLANCVWIAEMLGTNDLSQWMVAQPASYPLVQHHLD